MKYIIALITTITILMGYNTSYKDINTTVRDGHLSLWLSLNQVVENNETNTTVASWDWTAKTLPSPIDITNQTVMSTYGLTAVTANGTTDDSAALNAIAQNTSVTNWYIPAGKTLKVHEVYVPSHVGFIFGEGSVAKSMDSGVTSTRAFKVWHNIIVDGLTFYFASGAKTLTRYECFIEFDPYNPANPEYSTTHSEIRNCHMTGRGLCDAIRFHTGKDEYPNFPWNNTTRLPNPNYVQTRNYRNMHRNMKVYNNYFTGFQNFAIEGGDHNTEQSETQHGIEYMEIFNNHFYNTAGISIYRIRNENNVRIYNNLFDYCGWAIELPTSNGARVYNNKIIRQRGLLTAGSSFWSELYSTTYGFDTTGKNYWHNNHIEGADILGTYTNHMSFSGGNNDEIIGNYIKYSIATRISEYTILENNANNITLHNNTIVYPHSDDRYYNRAIDISGGTYYNVPYDNTQQTYRPLHGVVTDNDVYILNNTDVALYTGSQCNPTVSGNNFYIKGTQAAMQGNITSQTGGSVTNNYSGAVPTALSGAGLSDPNNIGVQ